MIDPFEMIPRPGAGDPSYGNIVSLRRPRGENLAAGALPASIAFTPGTYYLGRIEADGRKQQRLKRDGGSIAFFGDSNIDGMDLGEIPFASNYGIGGDTVEGLIYRLRSGSYSSLSNARAVVLAGIPFNNLTTETPNMGAIQSAYASVLAHLTGPLVILPPTRTTIATYNSNIATFNDWLLSNYASRARCKIIDVSDLQGGDGAALPGYLLDYAHWGERQQRIILNKIEAALRSI